MATKQSKFDGIGLDLINKKKPQTQEVNTIEEHKKFGYQGQKGHKLKRINMPFTDENHAFLKNEAERQGIWISELINNILDEYRKIKNV